MNRPGPSESATQLSTGSWQTKSQGVASASLVPGLTLLYHPDLDRIGDRAPLPELNRPGGAVLLSRSSPAFSAPGAEPARGLDHSRISRRPIRFEVAVDGGIRVERGDSSTSVVIDQETRDRAGLSPEQIEAGVVLLLGNSVVLLLHRMDPFTPRDLPSYGMVGESVEMLRVRREIRHLAPLQVPVLLRGESGTGKELAASALHQAGARPDGPYLTVNLSALPASLAAAELFGADRGSFTGADRRRSGYFEQAEGGTLFLDELGDASSELQALLLRVLESGEIQPLGAGKTRRAQVRVVAATDADLEKGVAEGRFRAPLLYRLGGGTIFLPALRHRRDDFGRLFMFLLRKELEAVSESRHLVSKTRPWVPASLVARLVSYHWPGNIRQLRNAVRRLVVSYRHQERVRLDMSFEQLVGDVPGASPSAPKVQIQDPLARRPAEIRDAELMEALRRARWHPHKAADLLGISRPSIYRLIDRCPQIRKAADLTGAEIEHALEEHGSEQAAAEALKVSVIGLRRRRRQAVQEG